MDLNKLTIEQLLSLCENAIKTQETYYKYVKSCKLDERAAFYQMAGVFQHIRQFYGLPNLY